MGKKGKESKSKGNVSAGSNSNVSRATRRDMRQAYLESGERPINQVKALMKGKDVVMTIPNPNKEQTNRPFIRKRISAKAWNAERDWSKKKQTSGNAEIET